MKIFVLNCGSSSIKYQLVENDSKKVATKHANKKKVVPIQEEGEQLSLLDFL